MQKRGCKEAAVVRRGDKQSSCPVLLGSDTKLKERRARTGAHLIHLIKKSAQFSSESMV